MIQDQILQKMRKKLPQMIQQSMTELKKIPVTKVKKTLGL